MTIPKPTTTVSTKGQIILPKAIRSQRRWQAGTKLIVEDTADGVLLRLAQVFAPTRPDDVFGSVAHDGEPKTLDEMNAAVDHALKERHARHRY